MSNNFEIESLAFDLAITMDEIVYLDTVLRHCEDSEYSGYTEKFNRVYSDHLNIKNKLFSKLSDYIEYERKSGVPINMAYRLLYKTLKET